MLFLNPTVSITSETFVFTWIATAIGTRNWADVVIVVFPISKKLAHAFLLSLNYLTGGSPARITHLPSLQTEFGFSPHARY
jgi:hypothetical protein